MKVRIQMDNLEGDWFNESEEMLQNTFNNYNLVPRKGDLIPCDVGDIHKIQGLLWLEGSVIVWIEYDENYEEYRKRLDKMGFSE